MNILFKFIYFYFPVGLPILCMFLWGKPYKRGFFCDDESIKHPFHESTVKSWMLWIIGFVLPVFMVSWNLSYKKSYKKDREQKNKKKNAYKNTS